MIFQKMIDNAPGICACAGQLIGGLGLGAADLYISYKHGLAPNAVGAGMAGSALGAGFGAMAGSYIKRKLGDYETAEVQHNSPIDNITL